MSDPLNSANRLSFNNTEGGLFCSYTNKNGSKVAAGLRRIFPNQGVRTVQSIELIASGPNEGAIICQTPGVFSINCGELPSGRTADQDGIAGVWYAENGDIVLDAPSGTIRILAENIELISTGNPDDGKGNVSISADATFRSDSDRVKIEAGDVCSMNGENEINLNSTNKISYTGELKADEGHDLGTIFSSLGAGSKTPLQWKKVFKKLKDIV